MKDHEMSAYRQKRHIVSVHFLSIFFFQFQFQLLIIILNAVAAKQPLKRKKVKLVYATLFSLGPLGISTRESNTILNATLAVTTLDAKVTFLTPVRVP